VYVEKAKLSPDIAEKFPIMTWVVKIFRLHRQFLMDSDTVKTSFRADKAIVCARISNNKAITDPERH
jgi:hypothetical protein